MLTEHIPLSKASLEDSSDQFSCDSTSLPNNEVYTLALGEGKIPVFQEPCAEYLCFPTIFCGQEQPPNSEHKQKVHASDVLKAELCHVDTSCIS